VGGLGGQPPRSTRPIVPICGCHVHVGIEDREAAIQVMNRARPWLAAILALSANSPFWLGEDTGYASYRTNIFGRFPLAGTPHEFASRAEFDELVATLVSSEVIEDGSFIYWDARPSSHFETLEFRVADVCLTVDEAVMIAGLTRALARSCHRQWSRDEPPEPVRPEILRVAAWRAARTSPTSKPDARSRRPYWWKKCSTSSGPAWKNPENGTN
jgi:carboxylate-amine ligase